MLQSAERLEQAVGAVEIVYGHNDLLSANFLDDGKRIWLVDWDYAGFNSPLFDLANLCSNNGIEGDAEARFLQSYFKRTPPDGFNRQYAAMKAASLLREALWSMVSEHYSDLDFDYVAYTQDYLGRFEEAYNRFLDIGG